MNLTNWKVGIVGFSSRINGKLVFRVNGNYEHNDIIQRYWDKENADLYEEGGLLSDLDLIVDTVSANNKYGYELRLLAIWDHTKQSFFYNYDDIGMCAECFGLVIGLEDERGNECAEPFEDCPRCTKGSMMPMYDEHPNWIKFCPICDYRDEDGDNSPLPY
ncbi:hypothetical protein [Bacillus mycoides]|uniref:Group-specific protein n=1 Tax=Bacillus mycoides TaxID=1405 RepID=A0ABC9QUE3_BACMY|nr:hypothetical protein [Bacillus mycoides]EJR29140.1 hypothetical protein III_05945 [Bacillus mycoides]